jgi:hypothetical protein
MMAKNILLTGEFMNNKIINAIKNDEFIVYLQSKHNILDSSIVGVYANLKIGQLAHRKLGQYQYN